MKNIKLFLFIIFLNSCTYTESCNLKFAQYLNSDFLKQWNDQTTSKLQRSGSEKAISGLKLEKKFEGAIFDRNSFISVSAGIKKYNDLRFDEISIFEIKYTGEKNQSIKYLIGSCGRKSIVIKFGLGINGWIISNKYKINTDKVEHFHKVLAKKFKEEYWGSAVTEIACLTRIKGSGQINVQVFESLSKPQFEGIMGLQSVD